jgi:hypothetical protein
VLDDLRMRAENTLVRSARQQRSRWTSFGHRVQHPLNRFDGVYSEPPNRSARCGHRGSASFESIGNDQTESGSEWPRIRADGPKASDILTLGLDNGSPSRVGEPQALLFARSAEREQLRRSRLRDGWLGRGREAGDECGAQRRIRAPSFARRLVSPVIIVAGTHPSQRVLLQLILG